MQAIPMTVLQGTLKEPGQFPAEQMQIDFLKNHAETVLKEQGEGLLTVVVAESGDGLHEYNVFFAMPEGGAKNAAAAMLRQVFQEWQVERYYLLMEAWWLTLTKAELTPEIDRQLKEGGVVSVPGHREAVIIHRIDRAGQRMQIWDIQRDEAGNFAGLELDTDEMIGIGQEVIGGAAGIAELTGRFLDLLPK
jgi:hypothetical protein